MSDKSGIEWTEATWNPTTGCTKVSPGCKFCYAKHQAWPRLSANPKGVYTGRVFEDVQVHPERFDQPLRWTRPRRIFVNSMSDLFHEDIDDRYIDHLFVVMALARQHQFQVLTKRAERMREYMTHPEREARLMNHFAGMFPAGSKLPRGAMCLLHKRDPWLPLPNVWLGVSVENQATADERIPHLVDTPAAVRWLSCEPLLGAVSLAPWDCPMGDVCADCEGNRGWGAGPDVVDCITCDGTGLNGSPKIHWVVCGGESGPNARPMDELWAHALLIDCQEAEIPFFMKQGSAANWPAYKDIDTWPEALQVREYPDA